MNRNVDYDELLGHLTRNQRVFCDEFLTDRNGTRAYLVAYPKVKKEETAQANASRMLRNAKVKAYIDAKLDELATRAHITAERVLQEEARLAFSDVRELFNEETPIPPHKLPEDVARAVAGMEVKERRLYEGGEHAGTERTYKYRLWDKGRALERLEKHLGLTKETPTEDNSLNVTIINYGDTRGERIDEN